MHSNHNLTAPLGSCHDFTHQEVGAENDLFWRHVYGKGSFSSFNKISPPPHVV